MPAPVISAVEVATSTNLYALGAVLYTDYAFPFEVAGALLLAAIIAAITLTHRPPLRRKSQDPAQQSAVRREDRIRLVNLPREKNL